MSTSAEPQKAIVVQDTAAVGQGLPSYDVFMTALVAANIPLDIFASGINTYPDLDDAYYRQSAFDTMEDEYGALDTDKLNTAVDAYQQFLADFQSTHGVSIKLTYHKSETYGNMYDEVHETFWELHFDDVYQLTAAAQALHSWLPFEQKLYTVKI